MGFARNYGAKSVDGFPSKLEKAVYDLLKLREITGEIEDIKRQETVVLQDGPQNMRITWRVDFSFIDVKTGKKVYAEAKGYPTEVYALKLKMFRKNPPGRLEIYKGTYKNPILTEVI